MEPTRFVRKKFFVEGYRIDKNNMQFVAMWCQGSIVPDGENTFIRVPVINAKNARQSEGHVGMWVLKSLQGGRDTFKVYTEEWLDKTFDEVDKDDLEEPTVAIIEKVDNVRPFRAPVPRPSPTIFSGSTDGRVI